MSAKMTTIFWRDIPAQVVVKKGRQTAKVQLPERFQKAIDRAAMRAGKGSSDRYLEDWRREAKPCGDDLQTEAETAAAALIEQFPDELLEKVIKNGGQRLDPDAGRERG